ncbi:MAG TPA: class D beta-lactamase [Candidatus Methylacidiphilales bacterium]|nr:class D beta-lactamase [Candidatus Methylacidiphilales bacterium]
MKNALSVVTLLLALTLSLVSRAESAEKRGCRLIVDAATGKVIVREGPCNVRYSPCSTFKVPLAVMGFDSGILKNEHEPAWEYLAEYNSSREEERASTDPTSWEKVSVVWYSQKLTRELGFRSLRKYVEQFGYGNRDVSGDPGKDNGLTESWLMSSLGISAEEQVSFVQKFLARKLGVSDKAYELTERILPVFKAEDGWTVTGKTGSGFQRKADGTLDRKMHVGWFIGWATKGNRRVIFAEVLVDDTPSDSYGGPRSREIFLGALPDIMKVQSASPVPAR